MNITFLIGNGFDLNLGLNTGYKDFLKEYVRIKSNVYYLDKFKEDILENFDTWASAEEAFGKYTGEYPNYVDGA